jgi:hypothetical protein
VEEALSKHCTHLLFLEDDMLFPADAFHQLHAWGVDWVGANYPVRKGPPFEWIATDLLGKRVFTGPNSRGLEPVLYTGFGVTLFTAEFFQKLEKPWFETPLLEEHVYATTDAMLGKKAQTLNIPVYVDHTLSQKVGHMGNWTYTNQETAAWTLEKQKWLSRL